MSLQRVLEPEVMDTPDEARDYNRMDHSQVNQDFVSDLLDAGLSGGDILDLGTGTALIPIELHRRLDENDAEFRIMAVDLAAHMLDVAKLNINAYECHDKIELAQIDAKSLAYPDGMFDAVISNSIIHHIPEPVSCLREAVRVSRPGGLLFFRDLLRPATDEQVRDLVATYAGDENQHSQKMFDDSLRAALSLAEMADLIESVGLDSSGLKQTTDRHWTWVARKPATD